MVALVDLRPDLHPTIVHRRPIEKSTWISDKSVDIKPLTRPEIEEESAAIPTGPCLNHSYKITDQYFFSVSYHSGAIAPKPDDSDPVSLKNPERLSGVKENATDEKHHSSDK